jgi:hypothetical protein
MAEVKKCGAPQQDIDCALLDKDSSSRTTPTKEPPLARDARHPDWNLSVAAASPLLVEVLHPKNHTHL